MARKSLDTAEQSIALIEEALAAKKDVRELLEKERQLSEIVSMALGGDPTELLMAIRAASYHTTHEEEKTPFLKSFQLVAAAYKLLSFIDCQDDMACLLEDLGITITIRPDCEYVDAPLSDRDRQYLKTQYGTDALPYDQIDSVKELVYILYDESISRRLDICRKMKIRKENKKTVMKELDLEAQEFTRLHQLTDLATRDTDQDEAKAIQARARINTSISNFQGGLSALARRANRRDNI